MKRDARGGFGTSAFQELYAFTSSQRRPLSLSLTIHTEETLETDGKLLQQGATTATGVGSASLRFSSSRCPNQVSSIIPITASFIFLSHAFFPQLSYCDFRIQFQYKWVLLNSFLRLCSWCLVLITLVLLDFNCWVVLAVLNDVLYCRKFPNRWFSIFRVGMLLDESELTILLIQAL